MTNQVSPAAQAVLDVFWEGLHCGDDWKREFENRVAAALRAAAQLIAEDEMEHYALSILREIATELGGGCLVTPEEYRTLYNLIRRFQLEQITIGGKTYNACDTLLRELFPYYYNQHQEQER